MACLTGQPRVRQPPPGLPDRLIRRLVQQEFDRAHRRSQMLALLLAALDQMIVATALPKIVGELHGLDKM
ncbi:hypothetical protein ACWEOA_37370, partial [Streptomyces sp. NPDC004457]